MKCCHKCYDKMLKRLPGQISRKFYNYKIFYEQNLTRHYFYRWHAQAPTQHTCSRQKWLHQRSFSTGMSLYLLHKISHLTIKSLNNCEEEVSRKHCGKRRKCWYLAFSPFPTLFSTSPKVIILVICISLSTEVFFFSKSKFLSQNKLLNSFSTKELDLYWTMTMQSIET